MIEKFLARKYRGKDLGALLKEEKYLPRLTGNCEHRDSARRTPCGC